MSTTAKNPIPKFDLEKFNDVLEYEIDHHKPTDAVRRLLKGSPTGNETDMRVVYLDILPKLKALTTYDLYCYLLHDRDFDEISDVLRRDIVRASSLYVRKEMITLEGDTEGTTDEGLYKIFDKLYEAVRHSELGDNKTPQDIENFVYELIIKISIFTNPMVFSTLGGPIFSDHFGMYEGTGFDVPETSTQRQVAVLDFNFKLTVISNLRTQTMLQPVKRGPYFQFIIKYGCIVDDDYMRQTKLTDVFTLLMSKIEELYTEKEKEDRRIVSIEELITETKLDTSLYEDKQHFKSSDVPITSSLDVLKSKPRLPLQHKLENLISEAIRSSLSRRISNTGGGRKYFSRKRKSSHRKSHRNKSHRNKSHRNKSRS
jgi:hypothetical protein